MSSRKVVFSLILFGLALVYLVVACGGGGEEPPAPPPVEMTPGGGEGPAEVGGAELLQARCTVCHDLGRVEAASNTLDEWEHEVEHMRELGAQLTDADSRGLLGGDLRALGSGLLAPGGRRTQERRPLWLDVAIAAVALLAPVWKSAGVSVLTETTAFTFTAGRAARSDIAPRRWCAGRGDLVEPRIWET
jgi:hypothetical protein